MVPKKANALFAAAVDTIVGDGRSTKFWTDRWIQGKTLAELAPNLFGAIPKKAVQRRTVSQALDNRRWVNDIKGALTVQVLSEYLLVWDLVDGVELQPDAPDQHRWKLSASGTYSCKSVYDAMFTGTIGFPPWKRIWKSWAPSNCRFFIWLAINNKCWTSDRLAKRRMSHQPACPFATRQKRPSTTFWSVGGLDLDFERTQSEYPKYTPLLTKILECVLQKATCDDKISHEKEVIAAADEVVGSIDKEELAKYLSLNSDPEDEAAQKFKKKMEETRDQLANALYQKGIALAEIESLKSGESIEPSAKDIFEENYKELVKWVDAKSAKYGTLTVLRERRCGRPGTALKVLNDLIQNESEPKKKLYDLKIQLIEEMGWSHVLTYEKQWMQVRFPPTLPPF
ncbi:hypothetical protein U9M48_022508 [Paspalum notatum var. saurae]|uniref:Reverse transcriptase zinc-binding domain-containing protein n=1 Tax=Paspalum notatum var. saurae TaxID=547442 RepID=A0AAQ3THW1_PASNO